MPNLDTLILTGNNIQELGDLDNLSSVTTLTTLRLIGLLESNVTHSLLAFFRSSVRPSVCSFLSDCVIDVITFFQVTNLRSHFGFFGFVFCLLF